MSMQEFMASPWKQEVSHRAFNESSFSMRPAPEFATGEIVLASLYRAVGFDGVSENKVPSFGNEFKKKLEKERRKQDAAGAVSPEAWRTVVDRVIQSPKVAKQSSKRFMSLSPIVPDTAIYSGAARLTGNPWNPGQLIKQMVSMGSATTESAEALWEEIHDALSVSKSDDIWARWLQTEFTPRRPAGINWAQRKLNQSDLLPPTDKSEFAYPARQFVVDLKGILAAKPAMSRRQWITLLEALLRIGSVSHVLWLCDVNDRLWRATKTAMADNKGKPPFDSAIVLKDIFSIRRHMLSFGNPAVPTIRDLASRYLSARLGINCILWALEEQGLAPDQLTSAESIAEFLNTVIANAEELERRKVLEKFYFIEDKEVRTIGCNTGIGANLVQFSQYTLGQRQTMDQTLRGYDQSYFLRKKSDARNAPWIVSLGPSAVLAMVHCCLHSVDGPRSIQRLSTHLGNYGMEFDLHGVNDSALGKQLRMLGLVLDSPDAESGMLLVPPFIA